MDAEQLKRIHEITVFILSKMYYAGIIGGRHTAIENLKKGVPPELRYYTDKAIKDLIKDNYIIKKPTSYGLHVYLNPDRIPDIEEMLENSN